MAVSNVVQFPTNPNTPVLVIQKRGRRGKLPHGVVQFRMPDLTPQEIQNNALDALVSRYKLGGIVGLFIAATDFMGNTETHEFVLESHKAKHGY